MKFNTSWNLILPFMVTKRSHRHGWVIVAERTRGVLYNKKYTKHSTGVSALTRDVT